MNSHRNRHPAAWMCALMFGLLTASGGQAAEKGKAGTSTRSDWCQSKLHSCVSDANEDCEETYGSDSTDSALCKSSEVNVCKNAYGSTSDCLSRDRVSSGSRKSEAPAGQKAVAAPENKPRSPRDRIKSRTPAPQPLRVIPKSTQ